VGADEVDAGSVHRGVGQGAYVRRDSGWWQDCTLPAVASIR
jgi:hypothetical protein